MMYRYQEEKKILKSLGKNDIISTQVYHGNSHQILEMKGTAPYSLESVVFYRYKWETYSKVVGVNLYSSPHIPTICTSFMEASDLESNLSKYSFHFITKTNNSSNIVNLQNPPITLLKINQPRKTLQKLNTSYIFISEQKIIRKIRNYQNLPNRRNYNRNNSLFQEATTSEEEASDS